MEIKRDVVAEDEFDTGLRRILNFGHTIGHAVEANSDFTISHGKGVAIGMCAVAKASAAYGYCTKDCTGKIIDMVARYALPTVCPYGEPQLTAKALSDKKRRGSTIGLVVPTEIGKCRVVELPVDELSDFIRAGI